MNITAIRLTDVCVQLHSGLVTQTRLSNGLKAEIDIYFRDFYKKIVSIAQKKVSYYKAECDAEGLVAEAYLYFTTNPPNDKESIPKLVSTYLQIECSKYNSKNRRAYRPRHTSDELETVIRVSNNVDEFMTWHDFHKDVLILKKGMSCEEKIVTDLYLIKGIRSGSDLARHFGIPKRSFLRHYGKLLKQIKSYETRKRGI